MRCNPCYLKPMIFFLLALSLGSNALLCVLWIQCEKKYDAFKKDVQAHFEMEATSMKSAYKKRVNRFEDLVAEGEAYLAKHGKKL